MPVIRHLEIANLEHLGHRLGVDVGGQIEPGEALRVSRSHGSCKHLEGGPRFAGGLPVAARRSSLASVAA